MTVDHDMRRLSAIPLLGLLGTEALRLIAFSAETRTFRPGDVLFRRGEAADGGFVILSGSLAVDGPGAADHAVVGPGALVGERAMLVEMRRPASATAIEATSVLRVTRRLFYRVLSEFPEGALRIRDALAQSLSQDLVEPGAGAGVPRPV